MKLLRGSKNSILVAVVASMATNGLCESNAFSDESGDDSTNDGILTEPSSQLVNEATTSSNLLGAPATINADLKGSVDSAYLSDSVLEPLEDKINAMLDRRLRKNDEEYDGVKIRNFQSGHGKSGGGKKNRIKFGQLNIDRDYGGMAAWGGSKNKKVKKSKKSKPDKPTSPTHATKPSKPTKPTHATKPNKPTKPSKPTKPTKPDKPDAIDKVYENMCLEPLDKYRTCYQRASDPSNGLKKDEILRNEYNYGAYLYENGERKPNRHNPSKSSKNGLVALEPYTSPYVDWDEELISGTLYLALNRDSTSISCDDIISMEELVLEFLKDNVGNENSFSPICVSSPICQTEGAYPDDSSEFIETTACQMDVYYVIKTRYKNLIDGRRLSAEGGANDKADDLSNVYHRELKMCSSRTRPTCCSGNAINGNCNSKTCKENGCGCGKCPFVRKKKNKNKRGVDRDLEVSVSAVEDDDSATIENGYGVRMLEPYVELPGNLYKRDFNNLLNSYTDFSPEKTRAVMGADNAADVAICSTNRYIQENYDDPVSCGDYVRYDCARNEDIIFRRDEDVCQDDYMETSTSSSPYWYSSSFTTSSPIYLY